MKYMFDMVHHNPGEKLIESSFSDPKKLKSLGYNGQVFKHIDNVATYKNSGHDIWPEGSEQEKWLKATSQKMIVEILKAKAEGLDVFYHIDLFVFPQKLVEIYRDEICDDNGKISIDKPKTLELCKIMLDEVISSFPEIDGFIIRVGETYLYDAPYHIGNGAVSYDSVKGKDVEKQQFIKLINFLRKEICVKHSKCLFFRTWDCFPDRFHADLDYYLDITNQVSPHEKLFFSIKHTKLDFWRYVEFNPCIAEGAHQQVIEIQCQREYEGKGAYPSYVMSGVIDGFDEFPNKKGLKDILNHPNVKGLYTWSRGGGWYGPYIENEFWPELNLAVIAAYYTKSGLSEPEIFIEYCVRSMGLDLESALKFRKICELSSQVVLKGRYCGPYDKLLDGKLMPCCNWMRDNRLGGYSELNELFECLYGKTLLNEALSEKKEAMELCQEMADIFSEISFPDKSLSDYILTSIQYGKYLFGIVYYGWKIMIAGFVKSKGESVDKETLQQDYKAYLELWQKYTDLYANSKCCSSLYEDVAFQMPEKERSPGMGDSVKQVIQNLID